MALQHSFEINGEIYPEAYSRVVHVLSYKNEAHIFVNTYADQATREQESVDPSVQPIFQKAYTAEPAEMVGDQFPKAYEFLKAQSDFEGAIDC